MDTVPQWHVVGDWFDVCSCDIPCPCEFAQAPTNNACQGVLAWNIRQGHYGDVRLDGFNIVALGAFEGNIWAGEAKARIGLFIDERADERQRQALQIIIGGQAGGWPASFAANVGEVRGVEFVPITFQLAGDLAFWQVEIPGRVTARADGGRDEPRLDASIDPVGLRGKGAAAGPAHRDRHRRTAGARGRLDRGQAALGVSWRRKRGP
jgi:hypothetical protein